MSFVPDVSCFGRLCRNKLCHRISRGVPFSFNLARPPFFVANFRRFARRCFPPSTIRSSSSLEASPVRYHQRLRGDMTERDSQRRCPKSTLPHTLSCEEQRPFLLQLRHLLLCSNILLDLRALLACWPAPSVTPRHQLLFADIDNIFAHAQQKAGPKTSQSGQHLLQHPSTPESAVRPPTNFSPEPPIQALEAHANVWHTLAFYARHDQSKSLTLAKAVEHWLTTQLSCPRQ